MAAMRLKTGGPGFTLLEVLVALSILSISLLGVLKAVILVQESFIESKTSCLAAALAGNKLARIKQAGLENVFYFSGEFERYPGYSWHIQEAALAENLVLLRLDIFRSDGSKRVFRLEELFRRQTGP